MHPTRSFRDGVKLFVFSERDAFLQTMEADHALEEAKAAEQTRRGAEVEVVDLSDDEPEVEELGRAGVTPPPPNGAGEK